MQLGPELFERLNAGQKVGSMTPVAYGAPGLTTGQVAEIEAQLGFRLPDDFVYLFSNLQDPGGTLFPWSRFEKRLYDSYIEDIWGGIAFDIEHNVVWLDRWGKRPPALGDALAIARPDFQTWPRLLPIHGHRFLAAEPCESGNPVFSIVQTDIIYYGADLAHYLIEEFLQSDYAANTHLRKIRRIAIWSDFAEA